VLLIEGFDLSGSGRLWWAVRLGHHLGSV